MYIHVWNVSFGRGTTVVCNSMLPQTFKTCSCGFWDYLLLISSVCMYMFNDNHLCGGREGEVRGISPFKRKKLLFYNDCCLQVSLASPRLPTMEQLAPSITYWHPPFSPTSHLHKLSKELRECVKVALTSRMMSHTTQGASVRSVSVGTMSNVPRSAISPLMNPTYCLISTPTKVSDITIWPVHKIQVTITKLNWHNNNYHTHYWRIINIPWVV